MRGGLGERGTARRWRVGRGRRRPRRRLKRRGLRRPRGIAIRSGRGRRRRGGIRRDVTGRPAGVANGPFDDQGVRGLGGTGRFPRIDRRLLSLLGRFGLGRLDRDRVESGELPRSRGVGLRGVRGRGAGGVGCDVSHLRMSFACGGDRQLMVGVGRGAVGAKSCSTSLAIWAAAVEACMIPTRRSWARR